MGRSRSSHAAQPSDAATNPSAITCAGERSDWRPEVGEKERASMHSGSRQVKTVDRSIG
jgi:hypothetical protein